MFLKGKMPAAMAAIFGFGIAIASYTQISTSSVKPERQAAIGQCAACHGKVGHAADPRVPHLAGQNLEYLLNQLQRFASLARSDMVDGAAEQSLLREKDPARQRKSELMAQHTKGIDGIILRDLAEYYSSLPCVQAEKVKDPGLVPKGIAWCADCHALNKVKEIPSIPNIHGQNAPYLEAQLQRFKKSASDIQNDASERRSHPFMDRVLRDISDERLHEVAQYYSQLRCVAR